MLVATYASALHQLIDNWVRARNTTWDWLFKAAGVSGSVGTDIKRGATPRPETLRRLSRPMTGVAFSRLLEVAGYAQATELAGRTESRLTEDEEELLEGYRLDRKSVV